MTTVISNNLVLSSEVQAQGNAGVIGYQNVLNVSNVTATSALSTNPITSVANPATAYTWEATSAATQTITIQTAGQQIDYIGIARHNLDQIGLTVTVKYNGVTVIPASSVSSIQAILFLQNEATPDTVEIIIAGATVAPQIGVIYIGKALRLERNIYVGHTPINYSRDRVSINGVSESGQYLGEIVVRQTNSTTVSLQNLTANWYRTELDPFFALKPRPPCFYAWRPEGYPMEVGYCWIEGKTNMSNQRSNGMVQCSFTMRGIV